MLLLILLFFTIPSIQGYKQPESSTDFVVEGELFFDVLSSAYDHNMIIPYKFLEAQKSSYIVFVRDAENNCYVVKQEKDISLNKQFRAVSEALCAYVANFISIPSQAVQIVSAGKHFPGKFILDRVATVHTVVPGVTIRSLPSNNPYSKIDIKQAVGQEEVPDEKKGFTERTIFWMSQHPDLTLITALDTFFNNKDRNKANMTYDAQTKSFYAIDMALMYDPLHIGKTVIQVACAQTMRMLDDQVPFSQAELDALKLYRATLVKLVIAFQPKKTAALFDYFLAKTGIADNPLYKKEDIDRLTEIYKQSIRKSHVEVKRLIYIIMLILDGKYHDKDKIVKRRTELLEETYEESLAY